MTSIGRSVVTAAIFSATLFVPAATTASGAPAVARGEPCTRQSLSPRPAWLSAAIWVPRAGNILAVDAAMNRLILYTPDGKGTILPEPEGEYPALLTNSGDRILVKLVGKEVVSLDTSLSSRRSHSLLESTRTPLGPLNAVYQWAGVDHQILAFGLVRAPNLPRGYQPGLFRIPTAGRADADLLQRVYSWDYYVLGYQYLTSINSGYGYFLNMDKGEARLFEIAPRAVSPQLLPDAVPPGFRDVPPINAKMNGPKDAPALYASLEQMRIVAGIYGGPDGSLYVLAREPAPKGATDWWLFRIEKGKVVGKAHLPTAAKHLSIVTAPATFYLIERGDVDSIGGQDINSLVAVPSSLLERALPQGTEICPSLRQ